MLSRRSDDAIRIPAVIPRPIGVDEQRFLLRRHEQSGLSSLDIDEKYAECGLLRR